MAPFLLQKKIRTSYKTSEHPLLYGKPHLDSTEQIQHSPLYNIFLPHKLTANGTTEHANSSLQGFVEDNPRRGLITCSSLPHPRVAQNPHSGCLTPSTRRLCSGNGILRRPRVICTSKWHCNSGQATSEFCFSWFTHHDTQCS